MKDMHSGLSPAVSVAPQVASATVNGAEVDLQGFNAATVVIATGAIVSAGDFGAKLQESDTSGSGYTDVAAGDLIGSFAATLAANATERVGYRGSKRYVRVVLTKTGGTSIAASAVVLRGAPNLGPVAA